jgi:C1A family cysteine protease
MSLLRSAFLAGLICTLFFIAACGGGGNTSGSDDPPTPDNEVYGTGNEDFNKEEAAQSDPLSNSRMQAGVGEQLPSQVDYSTQMPRVRSQEKSGSCTAWSVGYYGKSFQEAQEEGWDADANAFSPGYLFAMQCRTYQHPYSMEKAWKALNRFGCAKWNTMPFEDLSQNGASEVQAYANANISNAAHDEAKIYRCGSMTDFEGINQVKHALNQGPVALAIRKFSSPPRNPSPEENYLRYDSTMSPNIGHAILCVGYNDAKFGSGAFKFVNSWGDDWGENGFSWIRYGDFGKMVYYAMNYNDISNPDRPDDDPVDPDSRPSPPNDVTASDDAGTQVDVTWSPVSGAKYYRVYRVEVGGNGYEALGTAYQGNYRDYPTPGVAFYYAVTAINDLGESDHHAGDTDSAGHVDTGSATGSQLDTPRLTWEYNDDEGSHFSVSNIDSAATAMEVLVSKSSAGPWESLGWIEPDDFNIKWGDNSEYTNKQPFVRVRVSSADAASSPCEPVQVGDDVPSDVEVGNIGILVFDAKPNSMLIKWTTDGGNFDFFEIWRYVASNNTDKEWVKIGYTDPGHKDEDNFIYYEDMTPLPGVPYYYAFVPVYQGTYGKIYYSNEFKIEAQGANLHLVTFQYYYTQISPETEFPKVIVRNDGDTDVHGYTIGILAKSWVDGQIYQVATGTQTETLAAGDQQEFDITDIDISDDFANGTVYSWGLMVDYENEIPEVYESDNTLWSTDGWYLPPSSGMTAAAAGMDPTQKMRIGSTRPFVKHPTLPATAQRKLTIGASDGEEQNIGLIYNGPAVFKKPEFCIQHAE